MALRVKEVAFEPGKTIYTIYSGDKNLGEVTLNEDTGTMKSGKDEVDPRIVKFLRNHRASLYTQGDY